MVSAAATEANRGPSPRRQPVPSAPCRACGVPTEVRTALHPSSCAPIRRRLEKPPQRRRRRLLNRDTVSRTPGTARRRIAPSCAGAMSAAPRGNPGPAPASNGTAARTSRAPSGVARSVRLPHRRHGASAAAASGRLPRPHRAAHRPRLAETATEGPAAEAAGLVPAMAGAPGRRSAAGARQVSRPGSRPGMTRESDSQLSLQLAGSPVAPVRRF